MAPSRPDYQRSLALHEAVARRVRVDPDVVLRARAKLDEWIDRGGNSLPLLLRWREVLALSPNEIAEFLVDPSEEAAWLRSASPFAGALDPATRRTILREVRRRAAARQ